MVLCLAMLLFFFNGRGGVNEFGGQHGRSLWSLSWFSFRYPFYLVCPRTTQNVRLSPHSLINSRKKFDQEIFLCSKECFRQQRKGIHRGLTPAPVLKGDMQLFFFSHLTLQNLWRQMSKQVQVQRQLKCSMAWVPGHLSQGDGFVNSRKELTPFTKN